MYLRLALAATLLAGGCTSAPGQPPLAAEAMASFPDVDAIEDGDIVFRRGRDMMSRLVLSQGRDTRYSHVGMVVREGGQLYVVHAMPAEGDEPGGVRREPMDAFLAAPVAASAGLYRAHGLDAAQRVRIRDYLDTQIGTPFDDAFLLGDDQRQYCTELVIRALRAAGAEPSYATHSAFLVDEPVVPPDYLRLAPELVPVTAAADDIPHPADG